MAGQDVKASKEQKENVDAALAFVLIKKIVTPVTKTKAFELELVDKNGKIIKEAETDEEKKHLTMLDKLVFKLKRLLGSKLGKLNMFLFLQTSTNDFYDKLLVKGSFEKRGDVKRVQKKLEDLL